jgi:hypothetical protein
MHVLVYVHVFCCAHTCVANANLTSTRMHVSRTSTRMHRNIDAMIHTPVQQ